MSPPGRNRLSLLPRRTPCAIDDKIRILINITPPEPAL